MVVLMGGMPMNDSRLALASRAITEAQSWIDELLDEVPRRDVGWLRMAHDDLTRALSNVELMRTGAL